MKINYILSDTTKSATTACLKKITSQAECDILSDFVVIVPETKSIIIEKELLELSKTGAFANIFVYSFVRLVNRLSFVSPEKIVSKQTSIMLIRKLIFDNFNSLKCYQKTAKTIGFAEKIYDTIQQFKSSNISPEELKEKLPNYSDSLKSKLTDIVLIFEAYENALKDKFYDDADKLNLLKDFSKNNEFIKKASVFVVGFDNVTNEMVSVLKELAKNAKEITFSAVFFDDKRPDKYIQNNELYNKFKRVSDDLNFPYNPVFVNSNYKHDFLKIKDNLFANKKQEKSTGNVLVFEANSKKQEIDFVANQILNEINAGKKFRDIGVYACSLEETQDLIERCFKAYEIPYFINKDIDISNHVLIRFIESVLELKKSHLSAEKVLKFLSSEFLQINDYAIFENYINEKGVNYNAFLTMPKQENFADENNAKIVCEVFAKFQIFYKAYDELISKSKTISDFVNVLNFVMDYFSVFEKLEKIAEFEKDNDLLIESEITLKMSKKYNDFGVSLINFMGQIKVSLDEFLQIYLSGFTSIKLNLSPVSIDSVVVQSNTDGFFGIKTMFVFDAEDGKFPAKIQDSGIILDNELEETKMLIGKPVEPSVKNINERELFRVYEALLEPSEKLYISYSKAGLDGCVCKPSRMVLRLLNLFGEEIKTNNYQEFNKLIKTGFEFKFAKNINKLAQGRQTTDVVNNQYSLLGDEISKSFGDYLNKMQFGEIDFNLKNQEGLYFNKDKSSISQLEKYFTCPYLFFVSYGLRLKENKVAKLSSLDIGSILHRTAELFINNINNYKNLNENEFKNKVKDLCLKVYDEYGVDTKTNKVLLSFLSEESVRLCSHLFFEQENSSFKNNKTLNEFSFSGDNAVKIELDDGRVIAIEGKIDRIDEWGDYIRIIDYKTGDIKNDLNAIYYGKKIQLVSYLLATDKFKNKKVAGLFYFPIHSDFVKTDKEIKDKYKMQGFLVDDIEVLRHMDNLVSFENSESHLIPLKIKTNQDVIKENLFQINKNRQKIYFTSEQFEDLKKYNKQISKTAISEILSGYIEPSPICFTENDSPCLWCELKGFCGLNQSRLKDGRKCEKLAVIESFNVTEGGSDEQGK